LEYHIKDGEKKQDYIQFIYKPKQLHYNVSKFTTFDNTRVVVNRFWFLLVWRIFFYDFKHQFRLKIIKKCESLQLCLCIVRKLSI